MFQLLLLNAIGDVRILGQCQHANKLKMIRPKDAYNIPDLSDGALKRARF